MSFKVEVILDSVSQAGARLTTFELTYPRFIHAEFMTHRMFSRNAASSRAIPTKKMIRMVIDDPAMPVFWGKNKKGMSAGKELSDFEQEIAEREWLKARDSAVDYARTLYSIGLHKQIVNRVVEPWKNITVICTATNYSNFYGLRRHKDAQPEIHYLADRMFESQRKSEPVGRLWHTPYIQGDELGFDIDLRRKISVARCARVSYLTHDGNRDVDQDLVLFDRLLTGSGHGHWSPFEHVAEASRNPEYRSGNFVGWKQFRKMYKGECQ